LRKKYGSSTFAVIATIENKEFINDPEGETILHDLILKHGYSNVLSVRSAKTLKFHVNAKTAEQAVKLVEKVCDELRIFNPIVSDCTVEFNRFEA
jgi:phosphoribosylformylglycinamidine synthase subunit PurS